MNDRNASPGVLPLLVERWSPRSFDESNIPQAELDIIFEAAALAPSAFNHQPWRFLYAHRGDQNWNRFLNLLIPFNAGWAKDAALLIFIISDTMSRRGEEVRPNHSHSFDTGAAWALMALQATHMGYHAHGMSGIHLDDAKRELAIPEDYRLEAAVVIGRRASAERLSESLREREAPSSRKPVSEISGPGNFRWQA